MPDRPDNADHPDRLPDTGKPSVESDSFMIQGQTETIDDKVNQLIITAASVRRALNVRTAAICLLLLLLGYFIHTTTVNTSATRRASSLLVQCTTPGTNPHPRAANDTGNACWDRLHDPDGNNAAVALIVDDIYCDQRRAQHKLPAVPDPKQSCRSQTDPSIYPGA